MSTAQEMYRHVVQKARGVYKEPRLCTLCLWEVQPGEKFARVTYNAEYVIPYSLFLCTGCLDGDVCEKLHEWLPDDYVDIPTAETAQRWAEEILEQGPDQVASGVLERLAQAREAGRTYTRAQDREYGFYTMDYVDSHQLNIHVEDI